MRPVFERTFLRNHVAVPDAGTGPQKGNQYLIVDKLMSRRAGIHDREPFMQVAVIDPIQGRPVAAGGGVITLVCQHLQGRFEFGFDFEIGFADHASERDFICGSGFVSNQIYRKTDGYLRIAAFPEKNQLEPEMVEMFREDIFLAERERSETGPMIAEISGIRSARQHFAFGHSLEKNRTGDNFPDGFPLLGMTVIPVGILFRPHGSVIGPEQNFPEVIGRKHIVPVQCSDYRERRTEISFELIGFETGGTLFSFDG